MRISTILSGAILTLCIGVPPALSHDFWINRGKYTSPIDGSHCCGNHDCMAVAPDNVRVTPSGYALSTGEVVPFREAIGSEDGQYWRCKRSDGSRRCFFAPQPSS
jgi:hypothetical protein